MSSSSPNRSLIVAHRGASHDAPENSLAAFRLAWQQQSDGIEGDFYLTADQQIVCIHDSDTLRTAGVKRSVEESTLDQLRQLEYGSWRESRWSGEPIPTIEEVVQCVPKGKSLFIELKSDRKIVPVLATKLAELDVTSIRPLIIAFDQPSVVECKERMPDLRVHWLTRFEETELEPGYQPTASQIAATVQRTGADGVGMLAIRQVIDAAFIDALHAGGCQEFHVFTVDEIDDAAYFQSLGAVGITTNRPGIIGPALR